MRSALSAIFLVLFCLGAAAAQVTGVIDTVGGTTFDNQNTGPSLQWIGNVPGTGFHVTWTFSAYPCGSNWPDRTQNYNFYDLSTASWTWIDTADFMRSGVNSQTRRTGYGTLEINPQDGVELIGCHYNAGGMPPRFAPLVVRDLEPGAGIFDECVAAPTLTGHFLPVTAMTPDQTIHLLLIRFAQADNLYYSRSTGWCNWQNPVGWTQTGAFGHNLIASTRSNKLLATWMTGNNDSLVLHYRLSTDAGASWGLIADLPAPPAYAGDTAEVCARGASGLFDRNDDWQLVTTVLPVLGDSAYTNPASLWLYNSRTSSWHLIHRARSGRLAGGFGSHAAICDRPSLGENPATGRLFASWEQFDSLNVESSTGLLRADVWLARSDNGTDWSPPERLTQPDLSSKRLPNIARNCSGDSIAVAYIQDCIAGFNSDSIGAVSNNPVCVWRGTASGVAEGGSTPAVPRRGLSASPNPFGRSVVLRMANGAGRNACVRIYDASGRCIRSLTVLRQPSAVGFASWDGTDDAGRSVRPGCYFAVCQGQRVELVLVR